MNNITLSQTAPISSLPRDYLAFFKQSAKREEPVIFLRHGKPVGALVAQKVLDQLLTIKRKYEEDRVLKIAKQGMKEYREGKTVTELPWK
jgi:hypothetical protein